MLTGNSLGPKGLSVDIGKSFMKGVGFSFDKISSRMLSLLDIRSVTDLSSSLYSYHHSQFLYYFPMSCTNEWLVIVYFLSGFNAAVAGCFFAVESVLWPSPTDGSLSLSNTTSMVILSSVIASVISEIGLGSEPAFKVPEYDFRSPGGNPG